VQALAPAREYCPATHPVCVGDVDPAGQAYPAVHGPVHVDTVSPVVDPYRPGSHCPLHAALVSPAVAPYVPEGHCPLHWALDNPAVAPYRPATQSVHDPAPTREYWPTPHCSAVALVDPAAQAYPAVQLPVQAAVGRPAVDPYLPAGQAVHVPDPEGAYCPATHWDAVGLVDPAAQA
jgi:hypothetical protein